MRPNSLSFRLFAAAAAWALVALPVTAIILISVYRGVVERNFDARLNVYLTSLVASQTSNPGNGNSNNSPLGDPLYDLPLSGWYWQVKPLDSVRTGFQASNSLLDQKLSLPSENGIAPDANNTRRAYLDGPDNQRLRVLERQITLKGDTGSQEAFSFAVTGNGEEIEKTISEFRTLLVIALSVLGIGLVLATLFQVRFGLKPLQSIGRGLASIRSGKARALEGDLPVEIQPLQKELNALIESNTAIVDRARTHVGNLAHALKTPLSVITNEAAGKKTPFARKVGEQAELMRDQVTHHLNRASMVARSGIIGGQTEIEPVLRALVGALEKIYEDRKLKLKLDCPADAVFLGEKHDLEEMTGNLLDNACKWAKSGASLEVIRKSGEVLIKVSDDGPGLTAKQRKTAVARGRRLDETKPGTGLGLSIVAELANLYRGDLTLEKSAQGGLCAVLRLPGP